MRVHKYSHLYFFSLKPLLHYQFYRIGESICLRKVKTLFCQVKKKIIRNYDCVYGFIFRIVCRFASEDSK